MRDGNLRGLLPGPGLRGSGTSSPHTFMPDPGVAHGRAPGFVDALRIGAACHSVIVRTGRDSSTAHR